MPDRNSWKENLAARWRCCAFRSHALLHDGDVLERSQHSPG